MQRSLPLQDLLFERYFRASFGSGVVRLLLMFSQVRTRAFFTKLEVYLVCSRIQLRAHGCDFQVYHEKRIQSLALQLFLRAAQNEVAAGVAVDS